MSAEQFFKPLFRGISQILTNSDTNQFAGRTVIASGSGTVAVSTQLVEADSLIFMTVQGTVQNSNFAQPVMVSTISPGNFFEISTGDGNPLLPAADRTVMWELRKAG